MFDSFRKPILYVRCAFTGWSFEDLKDHIILSSITSKIKNIVTR